MQFYSAFDIKQVFYLVMAVTRCAVDSIHGLITYKNAFL